MSQVIKPAFGSASSWLAHLLSSLFIAGLVHLSLSSLDVFHEGFDVANLYLRTDAANVKIILLGSHPVFTSQMASEINALSKQMLNQIRGILKNSRVAVEGRYFKRSGDFDGKTSAGVHNTISSFKQCVLLLLSIAKLLLYKCIVFIYLLPLIFLSAVIGCVDGLIHRVIRTEEMGRESSFLFHKFSSFLGVVARIAMITFFILPLSCGVLLFPLCVLTSGLSSLTTRNLKKYL